MNYTETHAALIDDARLWVRTTSFAEYIPEALRKPGKDGAWHYRTDAVDTKVADALCDLWAHAGRWTATAGKKKLAALAGVSPNTALAAIRRLSPWFVEVQEGDEYGMVMVAGAAFVSLKLTPTYLELQRRGQIARNENEYTPRRATDPYQSGVSRTVKAEARQAVKTVTGAEALTASQWIAENTLPGFGEAALRMLDALTRCGELTAQELADETGKTLGSIRRAAVRLEGFGAVVTSRETSRAPKVYELAPDAYRMIEDRAREFRTWQMADCREEQRLQEAQCWATRQHTRSLGEDLRAAAWARLERLTTRRIEVLTRLHPDWPVDLVHIVAADIPVKQWTRARGAVAEAARATRERMAAHMANAELAKEWRNLGNVPDADKRRMMAIAGFDAADIYRAQTYASA